MKPLLIIPPAAARWPALEQLLGHKGPPWIHDIQRRVVDGVPGAQDAFAVIALGGQFLANACVNKYGDVGVIAHCYTRPEQRRRGLARQLVATVVSWFDMTGGKWLFLGTTAELDETFYRKFGFEPLRRVAWAPYDRLTMLRRGRGAAEEPLATTTGDVVVREVTRAQWPAMVTLLQYRSGPDPRVSLDESAVTAEAFTLDLIDHAEHDVCRLLGAFQGSHLVGLATVALDRSGERTYAMVMPHTGAPGELRSAVEELASARGYTHVEYPMEALRVVQEPAAAPPAPPAPASGAPAEGDVAPLQPKPGDVPAAPADEAPPVV